MLSLALHNKRIWVSVLIVVVLFVGFTNFTHAIVTSETQGPSPDEVGIQNLNKDTSCFSGLTGIFDVFKITCVIGGVTWAIGYLGAALIALVIWLLEIALELNNKILILPAVQLGWAFMRDVANLGFVLGIIVIAFATIIRNQTYGMKQLLVRLIVAAVVVNFSLSVAAVFLDVAGIPTQFFIDRISNQTGDYGQFGESLAGAFKIQNIREINNNASLTEDGFKTFGATTLTAVASLFFAAIFTFLILFTLASLTLLLLFRFIALGFALIMLPLAVLAWVFPNLRNRWGQWVQFFLSWTFFAPAVLFFLYLGIYTVTVQGQYLNTTVDALRLSPRSSSAIIGDLHLFTSDPLAVIGQMVLMIGLTMGGLFAARQFSVTGASAAYSLGESWSKKILRGGTLVPAGIAARRLATLGAGVDEKGKPVSSYAQRAASGLASVPGLGRLLAQPLEQLGKAVKDVQSSVANERKNFEAGDRAYREATLNRMTGQADPVRASALLLTMAKSGELRNLDEKGQKRLEGIIGKLGETNASKEFLQYMPEYAATFGKDLKSVMPGVPLDAYEKMRPDFFDSEKNKEVAKDAVLYSNRSGLQRIADTNVEAAEKIMGTFEELREEFKTPPRPDDEQGQQRYRRYQVQRNVVYENTVFQGLANPDDLAAYREERRSKRKGGGNT